MVSSKSLLVILLIAFANEKTVGKEEAENSHGLESVSKSIDMESTVEKSVQIQGVGTENSDSETDDHSQTLKSATKPTMTVTVGQISQMQGVGPYGLSITIINDKVTIDSSIIHETVDGMMFDTSSNIANGIVMIGNEIRKLIYCGNPNELILIQGTTCTKHTYSQRKRVSSEALNPAECAKVKSNVRKNKRGSVSLSSSNNPSVINNSNIGPPSNQQNSNTKPTQPNITNNYISSLPSGNDGFKPGLPPNNGNTPKPSESNNVNNGRSRNGRRTSRRRIQAQPNVINNWLS